MSFLKILLGALLVMVLGACAAPTSYREYRIPVPSRYAHAPPASPVTELAPAATVPVTQTVVGGAPARMADQGPGLDVRSNPWPRIFADAGLNRLIEQVLRVNGELVSAGLRVQRARLVAGLAAEASLPQVDGNLASSVSQAVDGAGPSTRSSNWRVAVSYEVDLWGKLRDQRSIAEWQARASSADLQSTAMLLMADACSLYWTLAAYNQRITEGEASLVRVTRTLSLVQAQFAAGAVSRIETGEAQLQLYRQQAALSLLRQARVQTRNAISVMLDGQSWPIDAEPVNLTHFRSSAPSVGLPAELLGRRPDLYAAELRLRAASSNVDLARSSYYPALSLTGGLGGSSESLLDLLSHPVATLSGGLSMPFLHWRQQRLDSALARTDLELANNEFRRLLFAALAEVDNTLSARVELAEQVAASEGALAAAVQLESLYEVRYRAGAAPLRTWLDAQESRRSADLVLTDARLHLLQNDATLHLALGGR